MDQNARIPYFRLVKFSTVIVLLALSLNARAQLSIRDSAIAFPMFGPAFQYQLPGGDMADRFGPNLNAGAFFNFKFSSNWIIGIDGNYLFSEKVREDNILDNISTHDSAVISEAGNYAGIRLQERGFMILVKGGKLFPLFGPNKNSGLLATAGVGLLQHKIRIDVDKDDVPELNKEYSKGYDRLSNGLSVTEFIGYMNCSNNRLINFFVGFEFTQAFTKNRRSYNFDEMRKDDKQRLDLLYGIKVGWFFPVYKHAATSYYYN